jgi:hypothetical protein
LQIFCGCVMAVGSAVFLACRIVQAGWGWKVV